MKDYIEKHMKVKSAKEEPLYFDHYDPDALSNILETKHKITNFLKKCGDERLFQILIIIDDFAIRASRGSRSSSMLCVNEAVAV